MLLKTYSLNRKAKNLKKKIIVSFFALATIFFGGYNIFSDKNLNVSEGVLLSVSDGDTISVLFKHSQSERIRLLGIDAPEKKQPYGNKAKNFLLEKCPINSTVKLFHKERDKYGRIIARVVCNEIDLNKEMVANGYAWAYREYSTMYIKDEEIARKNKIGLWKEKNPQKPSDFRKKN